jgi:uncharacterized protein YegP (UPF0339 family)
LVLQPFWIRAFAYGVPFAVLFGLQSSFAQSSRLVSVVISTLIAGAGFGVMMAYQTKSAHTAVTGAVAGLDDKGRAEAIAAVTKGGIPNDRAVRNAAWRSGTAYLGGKSEAQLKRREWLTFVVLTLLVLLLSYLTTLTPSRYEATLYAGLALLCVVALPLGVLRTRRLRRNVALLDFHLKAPNGEIIAASQGYESKPNAEKGIEAIKKHAPGAAVEDHS